MSRDYKMQKRHYQLIADLIRTFNDTGVLDHQRLAEHFANGLKKTNPLFSRERFLEACETPNYPRRETRRGDDALEVDNAD